MSWIKNTFSSSIGKKLLMSITGIFLIVFLVVHLTGNLLLLKGDEGVAFNAYAHFMKHNPLIAASEVILFAGFLLHMIDGIMLWVSNRKARPQKYAVPNKSKTRNWVSKLMGPFGMVILVFLILHLYQFFRFKFFVEPPSHIEIDGEKVADLASIVYAQFKDLTWVLFYVVSMGVVGFHLYHGFASAFQTLGLSHSKYNKLINGVGIAYSVIVPLAFALIPILIKVMCICGPGGCTAGH